MKKANEVQNQKNTNTANKPPKAGATGKPPKKADGETKKGKKPPKAVAPTAKAEFAVLKPNAKKTEVFTDESGAVTVCLSKSDTAAANEAWGEVQKGAVNVLRIGQVIQKVSKAGCSLRNAALAVAESLGDNAKMAQSTLLRWAKTFERSGLDLNASKADVLQLAEGKTEKDLAAQLKGDENNNPPKEKSASEIYEAELKACGKKLSKTCEAGLTAEMDAARIAENLLTIIRENVGLDVLVEMGIKAS